MRLMEKLVQPGQAHRKADAMRLGQAVRRGIGFTPYDDHARAVAVGARLIANQTVTGAIRNGTWLEGRVDGVRVLRHRSWVERQPESPPMSECPSERPARRRVRLDPRNTERAVEALLDMYDDDQLLALVAELQARLLARVDGRKRTLRVV